MGVLAVSMNSCCFSFSPKANVVMEPGDGESGWQCRCIAVGASEPRSAGK